MLGGGSECSKCSESLGVLGSEKERSSLDCVGVAQYSPEYSELREWGVSSFWGFPDR